jgi:putative serine protease PepD
MNSSRKRTIAGLGAALVIGVGAGAGGYSALDGSGSPSAAPATTTVTTSIPVASKASELTVNQIWRNAGGSVVDITVTSSQAAPSTGRFPFPGGGTSQAEGSGFVFDSKGDIVTNQHVVDGATSIKVNFESGKTYTAKLVGSDQSTDLAVIKVDAPASELKPLTVADSSDVQVGDGVVAIGSPFGLVGTVTSGIVSALDRQIQAPNNFTINGAIQTDAAINHGNSGGPLLDLEGKVIGDTAQIESDSGGNDGVGFAIASNTVRSVVPQLISGGSVAHAFLGVSLTSGTATIAEVRAGTPADKAGLQPGDVVTAVDGERVDSALSLVANIRERSVGDKVTLSVLRDGKKIDLTATLVAKAATTN